MGRKQDFTKATLRLNFVPILDHTNVPADKLYNT